jgi:hypothetical protein
MDQHFTIYQGDIVYFLEKGWKNIKKFGKL